MCRPGARRRARDQLGRRAERSTVKDDLRVERHRVHEEKARALEAAGPEAPDAADSPHHADLAWLPHADASTRDSGAGGRPRLAATRRGPARENDTRPQRDNDGRESEDADRTFHGSTRAGPPTPTATQEPGGERVKVSRSSAPPTFSIE